MPRLGNKNPPLLKDLIDNLRYLFEVLFIHVIESTIFLVININDDNCFIDIETGMTISDRDSDQ